MPQIALAAFSIYQGVQASKAAKEDAARRDAAGNQATQIGLEDRDYYRKKFGPVNDMLIDYAMGNKPSPYLAAAKGKVEAGYQTGVRKLDEIGDRDGLGQSGIGEGQKIGIGMERAKALAGLNLQDQAQRYGVAQGLSQMENNSIQGSRQAGAGYSQQAGYANQDMQQSNQAAYGAFGSAAKGLGAAYENGEMDWMKSKQTDKIEDPGTSVQL